MQVAISEEIPPELGALSSLETMVLANNQLIGSIPAAFEGLSGLKILALQHNQLSGSIPSELGYLTELINLTLFDNHLSGSIPAELGTLSNLETLHLGINQLSGSLPLELGSLTSLGYLNLSYNQLGETIPTELINLINLYDTDIGYNMLSASDPPLVAFLNVEDPDWAETQTVPPDDLQVVGVTGDSVELAWTPILYTLHGGYYQVGYATTSGGPYIVHGTTPDKAANGYTLDGLTGSATYYFAVSTFTPMHDLQQNDLWSGYSLEVSASLVTPQGAILNLVDEVDALVDGGALNNGQGKALIAKLKTALKQLDKGNANAAINVLGAFLNQVGAFINAGILTPEEAQPLVEAAEAIIAQLE